MPDSEWCELWSDDGDLAHDSTDKLDKTSEMDREWQRRHDEFHTVSLHKFNLIYSIQKQD